MPMVMFGARSLAPALPRWGRGGQGAATVIAEDSLCARRPLKNLQTHFGLIFSTAHQVCLIIPILQMRKIKAQGGGGTCPGHMLGEANQGMYPAPTPGLSRPTSLWSCQVPGG